MSTFVRLIEVALGRIRIRTASGGRKVVDHAVQRPVIELMLASIDYSTCSTESSSELYVSAYTTGSSGGGGIAMMDESKKPESLPVVAHSAQRALSS
jgi:hypothetical protein